MALGVPETYVEKLEYFAGGTGPDVSNSETPVPLQFVVSVAFDGSAYQNIDESGVDAAFDALVDAIDGLTGFTCTTGHKDKNVLIFTPPAL